MKTAFIGLGVMGYPMAGHLKRGGHDVTVYNRTPAKAQQWVAEYGGKSAPTPAEAAKGADIVFCCVGRDSDLRQIGTTLTRDLVYAVAALNGLAPDGPRRAPVFQLNAQEPEDLATYATALPQLVAIGLRPTVKWAHEQLGIPQPQAGEPVLGAPALPTLGAAFGQQPGRAAFAAQSPADTPPPMLQAALLAAGAAPAVDGWLDQVRALVAKAESLQDIRDGLEALLPDMTLDQYAAAMGQALAAAQLAGRYQVLQEAGGIGG